jgi:ParB-like chromosome segregation protein Spo0J
MSKQAIAAAPEKALPALQYLPLSALRPGHEAPGGSINARTYGRGDVADLLPSLRAFGVIIPLVVKYFDDKPYVAAGNRRLAGMLELVPRENHAATMIPTVELGRGDPLEISLIENSARVDLHPVDRFEVFEVLVKAGATVEAVALRYSLKPSQVRQALGLARLAPEVRQAWREDQLDDEGAEAFLATTDHAVQVKVLKRLGKEPQAHIIRRELGTDRYDLGRTLKFVGRKAYEAAGHEVNETLFSEHEGEVSVSDSAALYVMATERLEAECAKLVEAGWAWAITGAKKPNDLYSWKRVYPASNGQFPKELREVAGCVVSVDHDGKLRVESGYVTPGDKVKLPASATKTAAQRKEAEVKKVERAKSGPPITNALASRLSRQITLAVEGVLLEDADLAFRVGVAALACRENPTNIGIADKYQDEWRKLGDREKNDFAARLADLIKRPTGDVIRALAPWVAGAVDLTCHDAESLPLAKGNDDDRAFLRAIPKAALEKHLRKRFDAEDYFASMSGEAALAAIKEMGLGKPTITKKSEVAAIAAKAARDKGWLPPAMRVEGKAPAKAKRKARR